MLSKVYVETTVISYLTAWPSKDKNLAEDQAATKQWWESCREYCDLYSSTRVREEARQGDPQAAEERLCVLMTTKILKPDAVAKKLARRLIKDGAIPDFAKEDALHVAIAAAFGMDYLVTWNLRHINNPVKKADIERICRKLGFEPPIILTPRELEEARNV